MVSTADSPNFTILAPTCIEIQQNICNQKQFFHLTTILASYKPPNASNLVKMLIQLLVKDYQGHITNVYRPPETLWITMTYS